MSEILSIFGFKTPKFSFNVADFQKNYLKIPIPSMLNLRFICARFSEKGLIIDQNCIQVNCIYFNGRNKIIQVLVIRSSNLGKFVSDFT